MHQVFLEKEEYPNTFAVALASAYIFD